MPRGCERVFMNSRQKGKVGGTCLHRGCVPAKEFLETASVFRSVEGAKEFGIHASQPVVEFGISQSVPL